MKCSTANWTVTVTAAALLALAPAASAQTPPATPPAEQQPAAQAISAQDHLRQAKAALDDVQAANLSAAGKKQVAELKRRIGTLERPAARGAVNWGVEVAAMDKILTTLLGAEGQATGTTGTSGSSTKGKAAAVVTLDDTSRTKLTEVRTHLTAYAAAMSGTTPDTTTTTPPAATSPTTAPTATPPAAAATTAPAAQPSQEDAKRHLTQARDTLSALTQLPAAAQLTGEARTQVSQLISNFNELITTTSDWRSAYAKVEANMTSLLGPEPTTPPAATAGAVGTSGTVTLDPAVREKLIEMRKHLSEFERVSGGGTDQQPTPAPTPATTPTPTTTPTTPPATTPTPTGTTGATPTPEAAPQGDAAKHFNAIELMLRSQDEAGGLTLDKAKVELLRTHLAELRKLLERK